MLLGVIPQASELIPLWEHSLSVWYGITLPDARGLSLGSGRRDASTLVLTVKLSPTWQGDAGISTYPFRAGNKFYLVCISPNGRMSAHARKEEHDMGKPCTTWGSHVCSVSVMWTSSSEGELSAGVDVQGGQGAQRSERWISTTLAKAVRCCSPAAPSDSSFLVGWVVFVWMFAVFCIAVFGCQSYTVQ